VVEDNGLETMQEIARCTTDYLRTYPYGAGVANAYAARAGAIVASSQILQHLDAAAPPLALPIRSRRSGASSPSKTWSALPPATPSWCGAPSMTSYPDRGRQYRDLAGAGLELKEATRELERLNPVRRNTGVWTINLERSYEDGYFLIVAEPLVGTREPMIHIAGLGVC
jgi:hypothetical protein